MKIAHHVPGPGPAAGHAHVADHILAQDPGHVQGVDLDHEVPVDLALDLVQGQGAGPGIQGLEVDQNQGQGQSQNQDQDQGQDRSQVMPKDQGQDHMTGIVGRGQDLVKHLKNQKLN